MSTIREAKQELDRCGGGVEDTIVCVAIWTVEDVIERAYERGMVVTRSQAERILEEMEQKQDASIGISWDTIDSYLDEIKQETD